MKYKRIQTLRYHPKNNDLEKKLTTILHKSGFRIYKKLSDNKFIKKVFDKHNNNITCFKTNTQTHILSLSLKNSLIKIHE